MTKPPTARDYINVHRVDAVCPACDHWRRLDLAWLVEGGAGDIPLIELPLRCTACGATGHKIVVTGKSYGLSAIANTEARPAKITPLIVMARKPKPRR